jgi:hypothetical protein
LSLGAVSLCLVAIGVIAATGSDRSFGRVIIGSACAGFFALGAAVCSRRAFKSQPLLVFSRHGISNPGGEFGFDHLDWASVQLVSVNEGVPLRLGLLQIQIDVQSAKQTTRSLVRKATLFLTTGSSPSAVGAVLFAISGPPDLVDRLRDIAPTDVPIV